VCMAMNLAGSRLATASEKVVWPSPPHKNWWKWISYIWCLILASQQWIVELICRQISSQ
jgi:hypothetical protein